jgi:hypothetical protein
MATITNANLQITIDANTRKATPVVKCTVNFTPLELCQMKTCKDVHWFKLKCQLWGEDGGLTGADDFLYAYSTVFYFPDPTPTASESRSFTAVVSEGVLDEDWGEDEVYGKLILTNLSSLVQVQKKTNVVHYSF